MIPDELNTTIGAEAETVEQPALPQPVEPRQGSPSPIEDDPAKTHYENLLRREPYDPAHCTVMLTLQLLPEDADLAGRLVVIGVQDHAFAPTIRLARLAELALSPPVMQLLNEHFARIGEREQAYQAEVDAQRKAASARAVTAPAKATKSGKRVKLADLPAPTPPVAPTATTPAPKDKPQQSALF